MHCFTLTETKSIGLRVVIEDGFPAVQIGRLGESHFVPLSDHFQNLVRKLPPGGIELIKRSPIEWATWNPSTEELGLDTVQKNSQALVHIATPPQGGLHLTSSVYQEKLIDDEVIEDYEKFPPVGVDVLAIGGDENHMLVKMKRRSKFRILRPGAPSNKWHWAKVIWTGRDLLIHPHIRRERKPAAA